MPEYFAFERHPGIDLRGVDLADATLQEAQFPDANLDGVDAFGALANGIVLTRATLVAANFAKAQLVEADFREATAVGARFDRATMSGARLDRANLRGATFHGTHLDGVSLVGADVTDADFDGAHLSRAALSDAVAGDDLDCELFVDGAGDRMALAARIAGLLGLDADGHWLTGQGVTVVVDDNERHGDKGAADNGFLFYDRSLEWYFAPDVGVPLRAALIGTVMRAVRVAGGRAVAACDYEDALPADGPR